jgi:choline kinase
MAPLTDDVPKAMLSVGGIPLIERILDEVLRTTRGEVVVVTGYLGERLAELVDLRFPGRAKCVANVRFEEDVNILSVALGVAALAHPELGYTIVETDLLVERRGWERVLAGCGDDASYWVTRGEYGPELTGGIVHADASGCIDAIAYQPVHDPAYDGWSKMLGILSVAPDLVERDRELRHAAIARSVKQYYLAPWAERLESLPCRALDLGGLYASSFNTPEAFAACARDFLAVERDRGGGAS